MATWAALTANVLRSVDDPTGVFHTAVESYLEEGELLLVLARAVEEKTANFALNGQPILPLHAVLPDCLAVLRVSYNGRVLPMDHLATVSLLDPTWQQTLDEPEFWFPVGATHIGTYPVSIGTLKLTYLAAPSTTGTSPTVADPWQILLEDYARAVALGKEAQYARATALLKSFAEVLQLRDVRFLATDRTSKEPAISKAIVQPGD
jgi:hypothetical protein